MIMYDCNLNLHLANSISLFQTAHYEVNLQPLADHSCHSRHLLHLYWHLGLLAGQSFPLPALHLHLSLSSFLVSSQKHHDVVDHFSYNGIGY